MMHVESTDRQQERPFLLGVTGNIACGKSTLMQRLRDLGAATFDADKIYHQLIVPGQPLWQTLRETFGDSIIADDQTINRRALGQIVFSDPDQLRRLDQLTHPAIRQETKRQIALSDRPIVAVDAVKLFESGSAKDYDQIWLVTCDPEQQIERLMSRNGMERADAELRVNAQPPIEEKRRRANAVIDNSASLDDVHRLVDQLWVDLPPNRSKSS